jgi:hypothetical protein
VQVVETHPETEQRVVRIETEGVRNQAGRGHVSAKQRVFVGPLIVGLADDLDGVLIIFRPDDDPAARIIRLRQPAGDVQRGFAVKCRIDSIVDERGS